jgi:leishmanolysin-like peptidase
MLGLLPNTETVYSRLTAAFWEDTGWYYPNYEYSTPNFPFIKDVGCNFFRQQCVNSSNEQVVDPLRYRTDLQSDRISKCNLTGNGEERSSLVNYSSNLPSQWQYYSDPTKGGSVPHTDYCPVP